MLCLSTFTQVVETSGSALIQGGVSSLEKMLEKLEEGGVLFVDEAYQLSPQKNALGAQVGAQEEGRKQRK